MTPGASESPFGFPSSTAPPVSVSPFERFAALPEAQGLYAPEAEKDACGLAVIATLRGVAGHDIVDAALTALRALEHRGAVGADEGTGDGAGLLTQIPDEFFRAVVGFQLPAAGRYAVGTAFLPTDPQAEHDAMENLASLSAEEGLRVLGWRDVPIEEGLIGALARSSMPRFRQLFVCRESEPGSAEQKKVQSAPPEPQARLHDLDARAFRVRKRAQNKLGVYFPSFSCRTIVYKGMLSTAQLEPFYPDLSDLKFKTKLGIVHSRFSTNTFPSWPLAQPFRTVAHNGEINTVKGEPELDARQAIHPGQPAAGRAAGRALPGLYPRGFRFGIVRRSGRTALALRPAHHPRHDDDPRGLGEPHRDGSGP